MVAAGARRADHLHLLGARADGLPDDGRLRRHEIGRCARSASRWRSSSPRTASASTTSGRAGCSRSSTTPPPRSPDEEITRANLATIPIEGRAADPHELGRAAVYLASSRRRLRDRRLPPRRRRLRRGEVLMASDHGHRRAGRDRRCHPRGARGARDARHGRRRHRRAAPEAVPRRHPGRLGRHGRGDPGGVPGDAGGRPPGRPPHHPRLVGAGACDRFTARARPASPGPSCTRSARSRRSSSGPEGTTVNVIAPGFVGDARFDDGVPLGRAPEPGTSPRRARSWPRTPPATSAARSSRSTAASPSRRPRAAAPSAS